MVPVSREQPEITLAGNLELLSPSIRTAIRDMDTEELGQRIEITTNEEGLPICRYRRDGQSFLITSTKPVEEATRWYDTVEDHKTGSLFLFGCGFGYPLFEVFRRKQPHTLVVVFERDLFLLTAMLSYFDLRPIAATGRLAFVAGDGKCYRESFDELFTSFHLISCTYPTVACTLPAIRQFKAVYRELISDLFQKLRLFVTFIGNDHADNMLGFINLFSNAGEILRAPWQSCLRDRYRGCPAFIIANGPSLDRNIRQLEEIGDRGLILSVESAILPLLRNGLRPDILTVMERIPSTYHYHFETVDFPEDLALLCLAVVDKRVLPTFSGAKIPLFRKREAVNEWINRYIGDGSSMSTGPNISHLALEIALYLGADPIIFVGQDLAYGPDRATHSRDSIYSEEKGAQAEKALKARPDIFVEANNGGMLASNQRWVEWRLELERRIAFRPGRTYLNATEGGAKIHGTETIPLREAIRRYCINPIPRRVNEIIAESRLQKDSEQMQEGLCRLAWSVKAKARFFREQSHEAARRKRECMRMLRLSLNSGYGENREAFEKTFQQNNAYITDIIKNDLVRSFAEQEIFIDHYLLNRLGLVDTPEKVTELFTIQRGLFENLSCIFQSVCVHMENAVGDLAVEEVAMFEPEEVLSPEKLLSVCILTQGDESELADCLAQVKDLADEIFVVGMEPSEAAQAAVRHTGAVYCTADLGGDYGRLKNICLDLADGKWVLFLRAGDRIAEGQTAQLKTLLGNPNAEGYLMSQVNYPESHGIFSPVQSLRLVRRRAKTRFAGRSFERPTGIDCGLYDAFIPIKTVNTEALSRELDYRTALLDRELEETPYDSYLNYMSGVTLLNRQRVEEAIPLLQKALEDLEPDALYAAHLYKCLGWALLASENHGEAMEILREGIALYPHYTDLLVLRGELYSQEGRPDEALADLHSCLQLRELPSLCVPCPEIDSAIVEEMLRGLGDERTDPHISG